MNNTGLLDQLMTAPHANYRDGSLPGILSGVRGPPEAAAEGQAGLLTPLSFTIAEGCNLIPDGLLKGFHRGMHLYRAGFGSGETADEYGSALAQRNQLMFGSR